MLVCSKCGKALGAATFCAECDQARFQSLAEAMTDIYAVDPIPSPWWQNAMRKGSPLWLTLGMVLIAGLVSGSALALASSQSRVAQLMPSPFPINTITPIPIPTPQPVIATSPTPNFLATPVPTVKPTVSPSPSPSPTPAPVSKPTSTSSPVPVIAASAPPVIHNAPSLVQS